MEGLLPILLGLIFFGLKYYNTSQKKKKLNAPPPVPVTNSEKEFTPSLDGFIEQIYGEFKTQFEEPKMEAIQVENGPPEIRIEDEPIEEVKTIDYNESEIVKKKSIMQFETIQNKRRKSTEKLDFDLRKAVIYDAILNPPYLKV